MTQKAPQRPDGVWGTESDEMAGAKLELREIVNAAPQAQPTDVSQVSPVTTIQVGAIPVVYTQLFSAVPSQGPAPLSGQIGLGTLTGQVGAEKTNQAN